MKRGPSSRTPTRPFARAAGRRTRRSPSATAGALKTMTSGTRGRACSATSSASSSTTGPSCRRQITHLRARRLPSSSRPPSGPRGAEGRPARGAGGVAPPGDRARPPRAHEATGRRGPHPGGGGLPRRPAPTAAPLGRGLAATKLQTTNATAEEEAAAITAAVVDDLGRETDEAPAAPATLTRAESVRSAEAEWRKARDVIRAIPHAHAPMSRVAAPRRAARGGVPGRGPPGRGGGGRGRAPEAGGGGGS